MTNAPVLHQDFIDFLHECQAAGLEFGPCWDRATEESIAGVPCRVLSKADLIVNKRATGRSRDLGDAEALEALPD